MIERTPRSCHPGRRIAAIRDRPEAPRLGRSRLRAAGPHGRDDGPGSDYAQGLYFAEEGRIYARFADSMNPARKRRGPVCRPPTGAKASPLPKGADTSRRPDPREDRGWTPRDI